MAAEVSSDLHCIQDEDVLRRMWQQTEDFSRKKEIRARMYKLREQRLKDFYTTGEVLSDTMSSRKYTGTTHTDSIGDQGFLTMKTKEIRDSESPTREIRRREDDNNYWNTVQQQTSYYTSADGDGISQTYEKTFADRGVSDDGNVQTHIAANEKGVHSSSLHEDEHSKTEKDQSSRSAQVVTSLEGKSDNGGYQYYTSSDKEDNKTSSSKTCQVSDTSNVQSSQWTQSSSSSSSSIRRVVSSSSYKHEDNTDDRLLGRDIKSITADDSDRIVNVSDDSRNFIQQESGSDDVYSTAKTHHVTSSKNASSTYDTKNVHSTEIDINVNSNVPSKQSDVIYYDRDHADSDMRTNNRYEDTYTYRTGSPTSKIDRTIYKTELTSDVQDYSYPEKQHIANITRESKKSETDKTNVVVDQKIMTELQNLDTFLSTQNTTGTSTPVSPRSVTGDAANWTVVSNTDGEFVYSVDKRQKSDDTESVHTIVPKVRSTGQPSSLDIPKEYTSGQYVTTYQQSYTNKRISVDNSPTHEAFARSLRQSPPSTPRSTTPRSLSKASLDRSSPERKFKISPFTSPEKERRGSVGSHIVEKNKDARRKISETVKHGTTSDVKDVTVKTKRKLSSTQSKASSKTRASTPGTSPIASPTRKQRERSSSPSSENDSDASQHTYDKASTTSTLKRAEISKKKLVDSFNDTNIQRSLESTEDITVTIMKKPSPEKTIQDTNVETVRRDSKTDSRKAITTITTADTRPRHHTSDTQSTVQKTDSTDKLPVYILEKDVSSYETNNVRETDNLYYPSPKPSSTQYTSEDVILAERKHAEFIEKTTDISDTQESVKKRVNTVTDDNETEDLVTGKSPFTKKEPSPSRPPSSPVTDYPTHKSPPKNVMQEESSQPENDMSVKKTTTGTTDDANLKQTAVIETNLIFTQHSPSSLKETTRKTSYTIPKEKTPSPTKETVIKKSTTAYVSPKERSPSPPKSTVARSPIRQKSPKERSPSPQKENTVKKTTAYITPKDRSPSPQKDSKQKSPSPHQSPKDRTISPQNYAKEKSPPPHRGPKERSPSPQKFPKERSPSPPKNREDGTQILLKNERLPSPNKNLKERSPSPQKVPKASSPSPQKFPKERSPSPQKFRKERSPSPQKFYTERPSSPQKFPKERSPSPKKFSKEKSPSPQTFPKERSPSPKKFSKERSPSPKTFSKERSTSPQKFPKERSSSPGKTLKERSEFPQKIAKERSPSPTTQTSYRSFREKSPNDSTERIVKTTIVCERPEESTVSLQKETVVKKSTTYGREDSVKKTDISVKREIRQPSKPTIPTKDDTVTSRVMSPSPNKQPIYKRLSAPEKIKPSAKTKLSPQKQVVKKTMSTEKEIIRTRKTALPEEDKTAVYDGRSPSISPCSSPERNAHVKRVTTETTIKLSTTETPSEITQPQTFTRPTRRSSIPRSEKTSTVKKIVEKKTDIHIKDTERRTKPVKDGPSLRKPTDSPLSRGMHTQTVTTTFRTTVHKPADSIRKEPSKPTKPTTVYKTQKPQSPIKKPVTSPVTKISVTPKKISPKIIESAPVKTRKTTSVIERRSTQVKPKPKPKEPVKSTPTYDTLSQEEDRSSAVSSPETVRPVQPQNTYLTDFDDTYIYEDDTQKDLTRRTIDSTVHLSGVTECVTLQSNITDHTVDTDVYEENIEDEKPPEYFPDEDYDEKHDIPKEPKSVDNMRVDKIVSIKPKAQKSVQDTHKTSQGIHTVRKTVSQSPKTLSTLPTREPGSYTSPVKKPVASHAKKPLTTYTKPDTVRSTLDKTTAQKQVTKKQTSTQKIDMSRLSTDTQTTQKKVVSKVTHTKRVAETGIATRNVSAAQKRTTITKKKDTKIKSQVEPSSSSEDEEEVSDIPTDVVDEQTYIQELEDLRREEETTYASKVMSTSDQESGLLSVIVQHPTSSRESSPEYALLEQPSCTVSDDGSSHPRYADVVSEPDDGDTYYTQDIRDKTSQQNTSQTFISKERLYEKVTDLDEEEDMDGEKPNVSVADRVTQFLEQTKTDKNIVRREDATHSTESGTKSVLKAKTMFENIAKKQVNPPSPNNKPVDILSRPSVFEGRRGQTAPKKVTSDITITSEYDESKQIVHDDLSADRITDSYNPNEELTTPVLSEEDYLDHIQEMPDSKFESPETMSLVTEDKTYVRQTTYDVDHSKRKTLPVNELPSIESVDTPKKQVVEKKKLFSTDEQLDKHKSVEKDTVVHTGEISSKKAFFERKAQDLSVSTTKDNTSLRREPIKSKTFKTNEKPESQRTPDKKLVTNKDKQILQSERTSKSDSATFIVEETDFSVSTNLNETNYIQKHSAEIKPYEQEVEPDEKTVRSRRTSEPKEATLADIDKSRRRPTEVSTPQKTSYVKTNKESPLQKPGRQSPTRESPERKVTSTPYKQGPSRLSPERKEPEPEPKRSTDRPSRKSPERKDMKSPQKPFTGRQKSPELKELKTPQKPTSHRPSRESPERKELKSPQKPNADRPSRESPERKDTKSTLKPSTYKPNRPSTESKEITSPLKPSSDRPSRQSPERKDARSPQKPITDKPNRQSPERKEVTSPLRPVADRLSRQSPERKDVRSSQKPTTDKPGRQSPERKEVTSPLRPVADRPSRQSPERKDVRSSQKPTTDKPGRQSPERKELRSSQKPSYDKLINDLPERKDIKSPQKPINDRLSRSSVERGETKVVQKTTTDKPSRVSPDRNEPVSLKKLSIDRGSRESPERKTSTADEHITNYEETSIIRRTSLKRDSPEKKEPGELNRAGKFGVTLRRTSSTGSASTQRRRSSQGDSTVEIEDIHELALLEQMMEKAVGYEQRRRIRAQIRIVKRDLEEKQSTTTKKSEISRTSVTMSSAAPLSRSGTKSPTCSPTRDAKTSRKPTQEQVNDTTRTSEHKQVVSTNRRPSSPTKPLQEPQKKQPHDSMKTNDTTETVYQQKSIVTNGYHKTEHEHTSFSTVRAEKRVEATREVSATDSITSSYGVGPTDENGLPLFGLKALRRSNTIKTITNEVEESKTPKPTAEEVEVCDARGRPLFGLKALQTSGDFETMPEQKTSQQLKELVEKHEKNTRAPESQPRQKPRAKLRDSFILQQDDSQATNVLEEFNSEQRGLSLRSIIQKHENLAHTGGTTHHETDSSTTVVSTKSIMDSDGNVSVTRDVLQGEMSCKNDEEPTGKIVQTKYSYHSPKTEDNQKGSSKTSKITTTTVIGNRRVSGPKISEAEDDDIKSITVGRKISGPTVTEYYDDGDDGEDSEIIKEKNSVISSYKKRSSTDESKVTTKSFHRHDETDEDDEPVQRRSSGNFVSLAVRKFSGSKATDTENDDEEAQQNISTSKFSKSSQKQVLEKTESSISKSSSVRRQIFKDEHDTSTSTEDKKKTLIRGDSVRALQHKFQQASENAANMTQRSYPKAGLILRTSSFSSSEERDNSMKQSSNVKQSGRDSPEKVSQTKSEHIIESVSTSRVSGGSTAGVEKSERSAVTTTTTTKKASSFLDNTSCVSGVQDILTRMKNADLVVESGDTDEDAEARALLNKFLGASVILQGMEQGMKSDSTTTPGSAALVSKVEKQRIATSNRKQEEDIDNIWDEKQLRILLEACSDYEGRRKIRQRLRTVMAEHKACADVVADAGEDNSSSSVSQECFETKQMTTKTGSSTIIQSEAHSRTTSSSSRLTKANSVTSPFAKFKQLERQNSAPSSGSTAPLFKFTDPKLVRSASTVKERLLSWVQAQTKEYKNIQIENFSTSWSNGLAFCALIHHFCPNAFDYNKLTPDQRRYNFELAFRVAEEEADIAPLLDVDDMVSMRRPDWKCVFTYVQSVYRRFHTSPDAVRC